MVNDLLDTFDRNLNKDVENLTYQFFNVNIKKIRNKRIVGFFLYPFLKTFYTWTEKRNKYIFKNLHLT